MKKEAAVMKPPVSGPLIIEQTYDAPIQKVWDAITVKDEMQLWYFKSMDSFRPEPGFETSFVHQPDDDPNGKQYPHFWKITEVTPGRKISYEWKYGGHPGNSLLTFELFDEGEKTRLILRHEKLETFLPDENPDLSRENFKQGWSYFTGTALKNYVEKGFAANR